MLWIIIAFGINTNIILLLRIFVTCTCHMFCIHYFEKSYSTVWISLSHQNWFANQSESSHDAVLLDKLKYPETGRGSAFSIFFEISFYLQEAYIYNKSLW